MSPLLFSFFLVVSVSLGQENGCEPGFADSCFTGVLSDLDFVLGLTDGVPMNLSAEAVQDLCVALDDALDCTADVIDTDCSSEEGRDRFDSWLAALRGARAFSCAAGARKLRDILGALQCWKVTKFLECTAQEAGLGHIRDLLHTELDSTECESLEDTLEDCIDMAAVASCREQDVLDDVQDLLTAFLKTSHCNGAHMARLSLFSFVVLFMVLRV